MVIDRTKRIDASIDMTPLIDVVFQLLIFLMVTSHFTKPDQQVELPTSASQAEQVDQQVDKHTLLITAENAVSLNGTPLSPDRLRYALHSQIQATGTTRLEIRGDRGAHLGTFIAAIEAAKAAGIDQLSYHKKAQPITGE
ncbi:ExbD/TolR family protein [Rubritalea marina]|uniref:ExbD/TolR family protein n=1 Tax=Rubritalea marina TaxID=361055 RepID=UPI000368AF8E|nr:biopolymer transporter ExbD [Rubritalea marina]